MKPAITLSLLLLVLGCTAKREHTTDPCTAENLPEAVFKTFMKAIHRKDMECATSVTHGNFHAFLTMMMDSKLKEGADTVDRIDYESIKFSVLGEGGIIKYTNNGAEELFFLAKEDGQWKADLFGTAGNLGVGMMVMDYGSTAEDPVNYWLELEYKIGDMQVKKIFEGVTRADTPELRQFLAEEIIYLKVKIDPPTATFTLNLDQDTKPGGGGDLQSLIANPTLVDGVFEYRK